MMHGRARRWHRRRSMTLTAVALTGVVAARAVEQRDPPPTSQPAPASQPANSAGPDEAARDQLSSGLIGSAHDFRQLNETIRDLCLPCHTPHLLAAPPPRLDRRAATTQPLRPYEEFGVELSGWSLLCLGCHDGVTARDVYSSAHALRVVDQLANSRLGLTGLRSHPLGIKYPQAEEQYEPAAAVEAAGLPLPDGTIQCTTCHDAHNTHRYPGLLRVSNDRSRLCLTCHRL
jgi:predicted CXXCH cytochrome family protein